MKKNEQSLGMNRYCSKAILAILSGVISFLAGAQHPYAGTWRAYEIRSFKNKVAIPAALKEGFDSSITFHEDGTYEKNTQGETTTGTYEFTENKFVFYEQNDQGEWVVSWLIRWPKNTTDPSPLTPDTDLNYPERFTVEGRKVELDVYYLKTE